MCPKLLNLSFWNYIKLTEANEDEANYSRELPNEPINVESNIKTKDNEIALRTETSRSTGVRGAFPMTLIPMVRYSGNPTPKPNPNPNPNLCGDPHWWMLTSGDPRGWS